MARGLPTGAVLCFCAAEGIGLLFRGAPHFLQNFM